MVVADIRGSPVHAGIDRPASSGSELGSRFPRTHGDRPLKAFWMQWRLTVPLYTRGWAEIPRPFPFGGSRSSGIRPLSASFFLGIGPKGRIAGIRPLWPFSGPSNFPYHGERRKPIVHHPQRENRPGAAPERPRSSGRGRFRVRPRGA